MLNATSPVCVRGVWQRLEGRPLVGWRVERRLLVEGTYALPAVGKAVCGGGV
jgi:hypothetical protein